MVETDIFTELAERLQASDWSNVNQHVEKDRLIECQIYDDEVCVILYRDGSMAIIRYQNHTFKIFASAAKYWHRTRKFRRENKILWLDMLAEHITDKYPERIMKYYLDRGKKR